MFTNSTIYPVVDFAHRTNVEVTIPNSVPPSGLFPNLEQLLERTERQYLMDLASLTEGNVQELCRISGLSRSRLYDRLKKYNIVRRF